MVQFLERAAELAVLTEVVQSTADGRGGVTVVSGPAGIGKTALLSRAVDDARPKEVRVLRARATRLESSYPLGVIRQVFAPVWAGVDEVPDDGVVAMAIAAVGPEADPGPGTEADVGIVRGLHQILAGAARREPTLVVADDLQWADYASLQVLGYLLRRCEETGVGFILAGRPAPAAENFTDALELGEHRPLHPQPLSVPAVEALTAAYLGQDPDEGFLTTLVHATDGNPLLVSEVLEACHRAAIAPVDEQAEAVSGLGAEAVAGIVEGRMAVASSTGRSVARAAVVLGEVSPLVVATHLEVSEGDVLAAIDELVSLGIFVSAPRTEFRHELIRDAVRSVMDARHLDREHRRAARVLAQIHQGPEAVAAHLLHTAPCGDQDTVDALLDAARDATVRRDARSAITFLRRALEEPPAANVRLGVLVELASAEARVDHASAVNRLREAERFAVSVEERISVTSQLAALLTSERPADAIEAGLRCIDEAATTHPELTEITLAQIALARLFTEPRVDLPPEVEKRIRTAAGSRSTGGAMVASILGFEALMRNEPRDRVAKLVEPAIEREGFATTLSTGTSFTFGLIALSASDIGSSRDLSMGFTDAVDKTGSAAPLIASLLHTAEQKWADGDLEEAVGAAERGIGVARSYGLMGAGIGYLRAIVSHVERDRANFDRAAEVLDEAREGDGGATGGIIHIAGVGGATAALAEVNEPARALSAWLELGRRYAAVGGVSPVFVPWRSRAAELMFNLESDPRKAIALAREELSLTRVSGAPRALARSLRAVGALDQTPVGMRALEEAYELMRGSPFRLEWARSAYSLGQRVAAERSAQTAIGLLREAVELADGCGGRVVAYQANQILERIGADVDVSDLTRREREVSVLASEGLTNRDIAERLFLNVRTVETHISKAFRKLGIGRRGHLREALGLPPLAPSTAEERTVR